MEIPPASERALKSDLRRTIITRGCARYDGVGISDGTSTMVR